MLLHSTLLHLGQATCNVDGAAQDKEKGELGHCLSVLSVFSDNVLLNVAEADDGHNNADSDWYEASEKAPIGKKGVTNLNEESVVTIRETGHTMDKLCFKNKRN